MERPLAHPAPTSNLNFGDALDENEGYSDLQSAAASLKTKLPGHSKMEENTALKFASNIDPISLEFLGPLLRTGGGKQKKPNMLKIKNKNTFQEAFQK